MKTFFGSIGSDIFTTSSIYTHLDFNSKVASAQAIMGFFPSETT